MPILSADTAWPLWDDAAIDGAFTLSDPAAPAETAQVSAVARPVLLGYAPAKPNGRSMMVMAGGGYTALVVGREGVQIARWLNSLGYHAYVLVHRFPNAQNGVSAPLDDAMQAMRVLRSRTTGPVGVVGLSSGGHLAACLLAHYPGDWTPRKTSLAGATRPDVLVMGYGPISTNAKGRTIVDNKPPLPPLEKQAMYDRLQPDAQMLPSPPPTFIVYAATDTVVPVENAFRFAKAVRDAGGAPELHVFADGPHGFALDTKGLPVSHWPDLAAAWLKEVGFL